MRRSLTSAAVALSCILPVTVAGPAHAAPAVVTDPDEAFGNDIDISRASFAYSDKAFDFTVDTYGAPTSTRAFRVELRLTSLEPDLVLYKTWANGRWTDGYSRLGTDAPLPAVTTWVEHSSSYHYCFPSHDGEPAPAPQPWRRIHGIGNWQESPTPAALPSTITWVARTTSADGATLYDTTTSGTSGVGDGRETAFDDVRWMVAPATTSSMVDGVLYEPGVSELPNFPMFHRVDLQYRTAEGITPSWGRTAGRFGGPPVTEKRPLGCTTDPLSPTFTDVFTARTNLWLRPYYVGSSTDDPAYGPEKYLTVPARVTLDLPYTMTIRRGTTVNWRGVVRPAKPGRTVALEYRVGPAGQPWKRAAVRTLQSANGETYYTWAWRPLSPTKVWLRAVWSDGATTAPGGNVMGISNYSYVTVT